MNESERNAILVQYLPDIYRYSYNHFLKDSEAAREHTHDTIVKALECWDRYNPARCGRKAWLLTIAKNLALQKKRAIPCYAAQEETPTKLSAFCP